MTRSFTIGVLAKTAGVQATTIRFYEKIGLLPPPTRSKGNYRRYGEDAVQRLRHITHLQALGFNLEDVQQLLPLFENPDSANSEIAAIAKRYIADIDRRLAELKTAKADFTKMLRQRVS